MPNNIRYTVGVPQQFQQRASDALDAHDKADRMKALRNTFLTPSGVFTLALMGFIGVGSVVFPPLLAGAIPVVYHAYKLSKVDYEEQLDIAKHERLADFSVTVVPEINAEVVAYRAARARGDNEAFHFAPDYLEEDEFPPAYDVIIPPSEHGDLPPPAYERFAPITLPNSVDDSSC